MIRTTIRQALIEHPDALWRHHSGEVMTTEQLTNRLSGSLDADAAMEDGTLYRFHEIARMVDAPEREETR